MLFVYELDNSQIKIKIINPSNWIFFDYIWWVDFPGTFCQTMGEAGVHPISAVKVIRSTNKHVLYIYMYVCMYVTTYYMDMYLYM